MATIHIKRHLECLKPHPPFTLIPWPEDLPGGGGGGGVVGRMGLGLPPPPTTELRRVSRSARLFFIFSLNLSLLLFTRWMLAHVSSPIFTSVQMRRNAGPQRHASPNQHAGTWTQVNKHTWVLVFINKAVLVFILTAMLPLASSLYLSSEAVKVNWWHTWQQMKVRRYIFLLDLLIYLLHNFPLTKLFLTQAR